MFVPKSWMSKLPPHLQIIFEKKPSFRRIGLIMMILPLGFSFMFIAQGLMNGLMKLIPYSRSAYQTIAYVSGIKYQSDFYIPYHLKGIYFVLLPISLLPSILYIGAGIWILKFAGLCGQNPICLILKA